MGGKSAPVWKRYCHWSTFVIGMTFAIIVCGTFHFHLPLLSSMDDLQRGFPAQDIFEKSRHTENPTPDLIWAGTEVENWQKRIDKELMRIDTEVDAWHKKIWSYRDEIIKQVQLVDMDNEEEASLLKLNCFVYFSISTWIGDLVTLLLSSSNWKFRRDQGPTKSEPCGSLCTCWRTSLYVSSRTSALLQFLLSWPSFLNSSSSLYS